MTLAPASRTTSTTCCGDSRQLGGRRLDAGAHRSDAEHAVSIAGPPTRAAALTNQLLAFTTQQIIQPRVLDVNDTIADIRRMITRLIGENITVRFVPGAAVWHVRADPWQLQQVMVNLVVNSRDSMPGGGRLTIRTQNLRFALPHLERGASVPPGDYTELAVGDTGAGMTRQTLERLFEPFFTTKEVGKGTGLGLATVYGIIKQSGGAITVYSEVGHGTTFKIYLPRILDQAEAAKRNGRRQPGARVPLVEDEDTCAVRSAHPTSKGMTW